MDISIAIRETKNRIIADLNASGLPIDVMVYVLKDLLEATKKQAEENYRNQMKNWTKEKQKLEDQDRESQETT